MSKDKKKKKQTFRIGDSGPFGKKDSISLESITDDHPYFSHRYICQDKYCIKKCSYEQFKNLVDKLRLLSSLSWQAIQTSPREGAGFEMIPVKQIKGAMPTTLKSIEKIMVFRFGEGRIAGHRTGKNFYILFIDRDFTLYDHGWSSFAFAGRRDLIAFCSAISTSVKISSKDLKVFVRLEALAGFTHYVLWMRIRFVMEKYNSRAWQWFSNFFENALVKRV